MNIALYVFRSIAKTLIVLLVPCLALADSEISGSAFVQEDGTIRVNGNLIHLFGIYIPPTDRTCTTFMRPMPCGTRASLALDFRITGDSTHCKEVQSNPDGSLVARCTAGGENLSEWMLQRGWAVALPNAPFEYGAMEKIARHKGIGIWGIPVDNIRRQ